MSQAKKSRTKRIKPGDLAKVLLGDGTHVYVRVLTGASYCFYDSRGMIDLHAEQVINQPILFFAAVMDSAIKSGRWPVVAHLPLDGGLTPPPKFMQDRWNKSSFSIYLNNGEIKKATRKECQGLERSAVWEPEHIEDRLRDHYSGTGNKWVELLKME